MSRAVARRQRRRLAKAPHIEAIGRLLGDQVIAGVALPWPELERELRRLSSPALQTLAYRVERLTHLVETETAERNP